MSLTLVGVDFTSRPTRRKPITVAVGERAGNSVRLKRLEVYDSLAAWSAWLQTPGSWLGAFDLPFGLPRELVLELEWPTTWASMIHFYAALSREEIRAQFKAFCEARAKGSKFAHRATDLLAGASPSMKWVNPPVAFMLHAGMPLIIDAGVSVAGLWVGDPSRVALEGYPGLLAREVLGRRPYKSDTRAKQTEERRRARTDLVTSLARGDTRLALQLALTRGQRAAVVADPSGDQLDAVLCLMQAAWASDQPNSGLPQQLDPLEGWVVSAGPTSAVPDPFRSSHHPRVRGASRRATPAARPARNKAASAQPSATSSPRHRSA